MMILTDSVVVSSMDEPIFYDVSFIKLWACVLLKTFFCNINHFARREHAKSDVLTVCMT